MIFVLKHNWDDKKQMHGHGTTYASNILFTMHMYIKVHIHNAHLASNAAMWLSTHDNTECNFDIWYRQIAFRMRQSHLVLNVKHEYRPDYKQNTVIIVFNTI